MNDAAYEKQRARVMALQKRWRHELGLDGWHVTYRYHRGAFELTNGDGSGLALAECHVDWQYLRAVMTWNLALAETSDDEELEWAFVHECMHILVNEMRWVAKQADEDSIDHEERVASVLAWAFLWTRAAGRRDAKRKGRKRGCS